MRRSFYLDEDVSFLVVRELELRGHVATSTRSERRLGASDAHQLLLAADRGWTLLTHNRDDFVLLQEAWQLWSRRWGVSPEHAGILAIEQYQGQMVSDIARAVDSFVADADRSLANALFEWKRSTGWVRLHG